MWLADTFLPREPDTLVFGPAEWQKTEQPGRVHLKAELALKIPRLVCNKPLLLSAAASRRNTDARILGP